MHPRRRGSRCAAQLPGGDRGGARAGRRAESGAGERGGRRRARRGVHPDLRCRRAGPAPARSPGASSTCARWCCAFSRATTTATRASRSKSPEAPSAGTRQPLRGSRRPRAFRERTASEHASGAPRRETSSSATPGWRRGLSLAAGSSDLPPVGVDARLDRRELRLVALGLEEVPEAPWRSRYSSTGRRGRRTFVCVTRPSSHSLSGQMPVRDREAPDLDALRSGSKPQPVGHGESTSTSRGPASPRAFSILRARSTGSAPTAVATYAGRFAAQIDEEVLLLAGRAPAERVGGGARARGAWRRSSAGRCCRSPRCRSRGTGSRARGRSRRRSPKGPCRRRRRRRSARPRRGPPPAGSAPARPGCRARRARPARRLGRSPSRCRATSRGRA